MLAGACPHVTLDFRAFFSFTFRQQAPITIVPYKMSTVKWMIVVKLIQ